MNSVPFALLDWGELTPLELRARALADGAYAGTHRSKRRGSGIEFDSHRDYVPGDDLRRLDYRALIRHGRLLVRQFETDTNRGLCVLMDGTLSMAFRSRQGSASKLAYASLLAAALGRIAVSTGDLVSVDWLGGDTPLGLPSSGGREAFERMVVALSHGRAGGEARLAGGGLEGVLETVARRAGRGSIIVVFSDLLDLPDGAERRIAALSGRERTLLVVQVLDPVEVRFPFQGAVRLEPSAGGRVVETDADEAREGYLAALAALQARWEQELVRHRSRLLRCSTEDKPSEVLRSILQALEGRFT